MSFIDSWLNEHDSPTTPLENPHFPSTRSLLSSSTPSTITLGTGHSLLTSITDQILATCTRELLFVTCFWAPSTSLTQIHALLLALSAKALKLGAKIRVRIGFSSLSLLQKLFHTRSPAGRIWQPAEWQSKLGLPPPELLRGLEMEVKSLFVLPFCVMHPKFVVVDRKVAWLPSCNVSWERWFEGAVRLEGEVVQRFVRFWEGVWDVHGEGMGGESDGGDAVSLDLEAGAGIELVEGNGAAASTSATPIADLNGSTPELSVRFLAHDGSTTIRTLFLPSQYHANPRFRPFPWQDPPLPPATPLNNFQLHILDNATTSIFIQTPNLTSPPVLAALSSALSRGVAVKVITNKRLMLIEQLVTAGTTTSRCVETLTRSHQSLLQQHDDTQYHDAESGTRLGRLHISYFNGQPGHGEEEELMPVSSHLKMTVVDGKVLVLGSGNLDRASWYTSQELGVAFEDRDMAARMLDVVERVNQGRCRVVYDG